MTVVYAHLALRRPGERLLGRGTDRVQWWCWLGAGTAALVTLALGVWSGREYLETHPLLSVPILAGWLCFVWRWIRATGFRFRDQPAYIYMWNVGLVYFVFTFAEAHLFLFDGISLRPVRDIALQWKAYGALVGSFNLIVYGSVAWVATRASGSEAYARSNTAFALFFVGVLNSFTNYVHHTYHVPQTPVVKWVSFVVSMAEFVILVKVLWDCRALVRGPGGVARHRATRAFFAAATVWTALQLTMSLLISVPPLNAIFHGTHVVTAHAMGSMLGIDSMILFGALAWVLSAIGAPDRPTQRGWSVMGAFWLVNVGVFALWAGLLVSGIATGIQRYRGATTIATWIEKVPHTFAGTGALAALGIAWLLVTWIVAAWGPARGRMAGAAGLGAAQPVAP